MSSYFIGSSPDGFHAVHDRSRCPPGDFPSGGSEYLGEFHDATQALKVARLVYPCAAACNCCRPAPDTAAASRRQPGTPLRL